MVSTLTVPLDFQPKFPNFLLNGKHPSSLRVRLHEALFIVVSDPFTTGDCISLVLPIFLRGKFPVVNIYGYVKTITQSIHDIKCGGVLMSKV